MTKQQRHDHPEYLDENTMVFHNPQHRVEAICGMQPAFERDWTLRLYVPNPHRHGWIPAGNNTQEAIAFRGRKSDLPTIPQCLTAKGVTSSLAQRVSKAVIDIDERLAQQQEEIQQEDEARRVAMADAQVTQCCVVAPD